MWRSCGIVASFRFVVLVIVGFDDEGGGNLRLGLSNIVD